MACTQSGAGDSFAISATTKDLVEFLVSADRSAYLVVQREALALAERIKLISKAFFSGKEKVDG